MRKKLFYIPLLLGCLLALASCGTKRQTVRLHSLESLAADSVRRAASTERGLPASLRELLTFDQSIPPVAPRKPVKPARKPKKQQPQQPPREVVKRGTRITSSIIKVGHVYKGIDRVRVYHITHRDVPASFDGFRMAFAADLHYKSLLQEEGLNNLVRLLASQNPDVLLLGGDFHEGCQFVPPVIEAISRVHTPQGTYAVLGNNDYEACYDDVVREMKLRGIHLLEHRTDTLWRGKDRILVSGVRNPFDLAANGKSPTLGLHVDDFVVLLTHTPDYAEDVSIANSDLVLAGHTHGGQVTLFGLYAPVVPSRYGQRFLSGLKYNSRYTPMIITNGIGTSQKAVRVFAPSEIVLIVLHRLVD